MADFAFPLLALMQEVESAMAAADITVPHLFGARQRSTHRSPPGYVWVPTRSTDVKEPFTRQVDEYRTVGSQSEHIEIDCWGATFEQAWALRQNLGKALYDAGLADLQFERAEWLRPGEAWNQKGEIIRVEYSLDVPIIDAFVDVGTLEEPQPDTFYAARTEGRIYLSPDTETEGELGPEVTSP